MAPGVRVLAHLYQLHVLRVRVERRRMCVYPSFRTDPAADVASTVRRGARQERRPSGALRVAERGKGEKRSLRPEPGGSRAEAAHSRLALEASLHKASRTLQLGIAPLPPAVSAVCPVESASPATWSQWSCGECPRHLIVS